VRHDGREIGRSVNCRHGVHPNTSLKKQGHGRCSAWGGLREQDLLCGDGGFFGHRAGIGATDCLAVFGNHLPDLGNAFTALGLAPHAVKETGRSAYALSERLLDLLLIKSVADADIHDRLNPADDALMIRAVENECQSLYWPGIVGSPGARSWPSIQCLVYVPVPNTLPVKSLAKC
jgi:hypothetical protein